MSPLAGPTPVLHAEDICAGYGYREVLHRVSLTVAENDVVALYGDNGAGKSTLLKTIAGLVAPASGRVCVNGHPSTGLRPHAVHGLGVAYLPQGGRVFVNLTVAENLWIARRKAYRPGALGEDGWHPCEALKALWHVRTGLLSSGERQMLALEMALCQHPSLLLLDEPTAGLSPEMAFAFMRSLSAFASAPGRAAILAEQNVELARMAATRSLSLVNGQIAVTVDRVA